ncbi:hypothetical protein AYK61_12160 [Rhodococcus sp. SBT000017]|nr:hypothetical protein AYK61_12160 [Rhodococcus sp. SBT000017]
MKRIRGAAAFQRSLKDRLKTESKLRGRPYEYLHREFYLQRFLARIFSQPEGRWLLKGGASLLVRLPDARYSQDIDLLHTTAGLKEAVEDLRAAADLSELDPLRFAIRDAPTAMTGGVDGAKLKVDVYYDALKLFTFPIDLATELVAVGDVDYQYPTPIVVMDDLATMPEFALYPLPAQIADKVCAMYGKYGSNGGPSSRYHDLVDLVLIISAWRFAADALTRGLFQESERRGLDLPSAMSAPSSAWTAGYERLARTVSGLPDSALTLDSALAAAGRCLDPILSNRVVGGFWDPGIAEWAE